MPPALCGPGLRLVCLALLCWRGLGSEASCEAEPASDSCSLLQRGQHDLFSGSARAERSRKLGGSLVSHGSPAAAPAGEDDVGDGAEHGHGHGGESGHEHDGEDGHEHGGDGAGERGGHKKNGHDGQLGGESGGEHGGELGGEHGGEHGGAHGEHAGGHHSFTSTDIATGACFVGFVVIMMAALNMTNNTDEDIRAASYNMVSQTISIFCAVLLYSNICMLLESTFGPSGSGIAIQFALFVMLLTIVFINVARMKSKVSLAAIGILGGHLVGYAALSTFGTLQRQDPFSRHIFSTFAVSGVSYFLLLKLFQAFADRMIECAGSERSAIHKREDTLEECEEDAYCFCTGFLLAECSKFTVLGVFTPLHGNPLGHTQEQVNLLLVWCAGYVVSVMAIAPLNKFARHIHAARTARFLFLAQHTLMMATAWMFVYIGEWEWFVVDTASSRSSGIMLVSFVGTLFAFGMVFVLDFIADREWIPPASVRAVISVIATAVGLSWEKSFHEAEHALTSPLSHPLIMRTLLAVFVLSIVVSTWLYYILPHAIDIAEEGEKKEEEEEEQFEHGKPAEAAAAVR